MTAPVDARFAHLDDPAERAWLTAVAPADVLANAHRFYDFMEDADIPADSYIRELAFCKVAQDLGVDYEVLYQAWLNEQPVSRESVTATAVVPVIEVNDTVTVDGQGLWTVETIVDGGRRYEVSTGSTTTGPQCKTTHVTFVTVDAERVRFVRKGNATDDAIAELDKILGGQ